MESDLARYYQLDARRVWSRNPAELIGVRRLIVLLAGLPDESALRSSQREPSEDWTVDSELLAQAVDALNVIASEYRRKGKPSVTPRPGGLTHQAASPAEIAAFFAEAG